MRYLANGFIPITEPSARINKPAAAVNIVKGDTLHDNGSGYATNATTAFDSATFLGVAAADCDNSGGSAGDKDVEIYPFDPTKRYIVPVAEDGLIVQTDVGTNVDLENNDDIDLSDTVTEGLCFHIDDLDDSSDAQAANTYGYAIGHFMVIVTEA